ncbi:Ribosomal RNA small subunit methyltransferase C [Candidatus Erwinia haradaeae]|uniref:Ribosomal RNA small subunit methyltransferase C n=1 Tax=Candidatus Erwinia haradaeae TaxID=1922217 RepID=A0A451DCS1_9GAMM|nr:16S rRNA (guanine(1207)-N(2))-methyltransferase RsmC [Candidatus Erwinia haradaeae]VFP84209.1 Ribosomal RNA small subunit methyltransferase C [Candidatus Erwinia haradaeae]
MSILTPESNMLLRNRDQFTHRNVLFSGDLQDTLSAYIETQTRCIYTQQYLHWKILKEILGKNTYFGVIMTSNMLNKCDTLIYYWPKNKQKAQFQLQNLLSLLPCGSEIFIVGEHRSGVRSATNCIKNWVELRKIDSARHCGLYHGYLEKQPYFNLNTFWHEYLVGSLTIQSLPGVFGYNGLDRGTQLLLSTLIDNNIRGRILDVGCGTGILAAMLASYSQATHLTLTDVNAAALSSSQATFSCNTLRGTILPSNVYSNITGRFDVIISNPPFHDRFKRNLDITRVLIQKAPDYLYIGGELRIVANSFLPYKKIFNETFDYHEVLISNGDFKVYRAIKTK